MTLDLLGLLAANLCFLAAGLGVTRAAGWWRSPREAPGALGVSYLVGVASLGVVSCLLLIAGAALTLLQVLAVTAVLAALGLTPGRSGAPAVGYRIPLAPAGLVALVLTALAVDLWYQPLWKYDAWTFWTPKARALVELDGLDAEWFTAADLLNPDYPVLVPALEAIVFRFSGVAPEVLDFQSWLLVAGFGLALIEVARRRGPTALAAWPAAMALTAPSLGIQAATAEADMPLAVLVACAGGLGVVWLEEGRAGTLALVGVLLGAALAAKIEGTIFAAAVLVPLAALAWRRRAPRDGLLVLGVGAAAAAVALLPWRLWLRAHDVENQASLGRVTDVGLLRDEAGRVPEAAGRMLWELVDPRSWLLVVPVAVAAAVLALRRGRGPAAVLLLSSLVLSVTGLVLAYWTSPLELDFHLATSASRVITAPVLLAALLTPLLLADAVGGEQSPDA